MVDSPGSSPSAVWAGWEPHGVCASISPGVGVDPWWCTCDGHGFHV